MKTKLIALMMSVLVAGPAMMAQSDPVNVKTADIDWQTPALTDSLSRAIGTIIGANVRNTLISVAGMGIGLDRATVQKAMLDYIDGKDTGFTPQDADSFMQDAVRGAIEARVDTVSVASQTAFLNEAAGREGAIVQPSGLVLEVVQEGEGTYPTLSNQVVLTYTGKLSDGSVFDQTNDGPVTFPVSGVVPGFAEGLQLMKPGGTYRLVLPASLAYGEKGIPGAIPGNAALDFTITLISVK